MLYQTLDLPSGQRQRFVVDACHSAPELLVQVQILLARIDVLDVLVAAPFALFAPKLPPPAVILPPGAMLADWCLLRDIARMVDAGRTREGRPFFVMDLPEGVPLDQYCANQQLSLRQCAALFARICNAVQHAHQR